MSIVRIESPADPRLAVYRDLKSPEAKRRGPLFVVEGMLLVQRLLSSGLRVASVLAEERFAEELLTRIPPDTLLYVIPNLSAAEEAGERHGHSFVSGLAGFKFHRGVLACGYRPASADLDRLLEAAGSTAIFSVCVGVGDPENLGGIIRSSAAFGATALIVGPHCVDPFSAPSGPYFDGFEPEAARR
jgi:tRNA G18 (ribose-2'-O)-methylase SpoU